MAPAPALWGVIVGDDGSPEAEVALRWAAGEAELRGRPLHVVRAWTTATASRPADWSPGYVPSRQEYQAACLESLDRRLAELRTQRPDLVIQGHAIYGSSTAVLVGVSENADILVIGHRGRAGLRARMLGSTAAEVVERAGCSVLVVRSYRT